MFIVYRRILRAFKTMIPPDGSLCGRFIFLTSVCGKIYRFSVRGDVVAKLNGT
jgi:hypothetical protein